MVGTETHHITADAATRRKQFNERAIHTEILNISTILIALTFFRFSAQHHAPRKFSTVVLKTLWKNSRAIP